VRAFDREDPGASYRVRLIYGDGHERLCGPWEKLTTAKSIRTRELNYSALYMQYPTHQIVDAVIERATGWETV